MLERGVGRRRHARARAVAGAVAVVAEKRTTAMHATFRRIGIARIARPRRPLWIHRNATLARRARNHCVGIVGIEVCAPLPHIARHVEEPKAVWRKTLDRRCTLEAVIFGVFAGKIALPDVATPRLSRSGINWLIAPSIHLLRKPAARGELPLGFGRQPLASPFAIRHRIIEGDLHNGNGVLPIDGTGRALRMTPVCAWRPRPPTRVVLGGLTSSRRREDQRSGNEHLVGRLGRAFGHLLLQLVPIDRPLGDGLVARGRDEGAELRVGDFGRVHPEAVNLHLVLRRLVGPSKRIGRAHDELAAGNPEHAHWCVDGRNGRVLRRRGRENRKQRE